MIRAHRVIKVDFANGATDATATVDVSWMAFGIIHVPSEFNSDTLSFKSVGPSGTWGTSTVFTKAVTTGANPLTAEEISKFGGIGKLLISTNNAVSAASALWLELKS